jgi:ubiquinone/menaquinone biosynthesis C-methylase UbiE
MGFYNERIPPRLIDLAMRQGDLTPYRARVVSAAQGVVLEIGVGSGLNLPFYSAGVERVVGLDPAARLLRMARWHAAAAGAPPFDLMRASAEAVPLRDASIDTVVKDLVESGVAQVARLQQRGFSYIKI